MQMYFAPFVDIVLFYRILLVVRSAAHVISSLRYIIQLPPAVIRTLLGSSFYGL